VISYPEVAVLGRMELTPPPNRFIKVIPSVVISSEANVWVVAFTPRIEGLTLEFAVIVAVFALRSTTTSNKLVCASTLTVTRATNNPTRAKCFIVG
jgi:hypothetical protein